MEKRLNQKWLLISHGFNMDGRASSLTVTDKIPYMLAAGVEPVVLSAITGYQDQKLEHYQLLPWGPSGLRFDFRHWVAKTYGRGWAYKVFTPLVSLLLLPFTAIEKLFIGLSSQSSWSYSAAYQGKKIIRKQSIECIYSSGGAWSAHYAAWLIKKATGKKWIAEIHDPMVIRDDEADDGTAPRKSRDKRFLQKLEHLICKDADHVWWFTQGALDYAKLRNPELGNKGFVVFPGAEPPGCHEPLPEKHHYGDQLVRGHVGSIASDRSLAPILQAMKVFFQAHPEAEQKIRIQVYGSSLDSSSQEAMDQLGLAHVVQAMGRIENDPITGKTGRERIMEIMRKMDVLLLLHGDYEWCAEYIPSKAYEYFWAQRPILALTHRNPAFNQLLGEYHAYIAEQSNPRAIIAALEQVYAAWQQQQMPVISAKPLGVDQAVQTILHAVSELN